MVQVDVIVAVTPHIGVRAVRPRNPRNLKPPKHRLSSTQVRVTWSPTSQTGAESGAEPGLSAGDNESTSVITPDELQAYFSRLAQEVNTGDDSADDGQEES